MAPSLISGYSKDLTDFPWCDTKTLIREGYLVAPRTFSLLRLSEYSLTNAECPFCLVVTCLGCGTDGWYEGYGAERGAEGQIEREIIVELLASGMEDEEKDTVIARFAYQPYHFQSSDGDREGMQIKGAYVDPYFDQKGLARTVYGFLLSWYDHIVCDNKQTVYGAKIWASGMRSIGRVKVYDARVPGFIDVLAEGGIGADGVKPWDGLSLTQAQLVDWEPNHLNIESCTQIVNIISARDRRYAPGITTFDRRSGRPKMIVVQ